MLPIIVRAHQNVSRSNMKDPGGISLISALGDDHEEYRFVCDGEALMRDPAVDWTREGPSQNLMIKVLGAIKKIHGPGANTPQVVPLFTEAGPAGARVLRGVAVFLAQWPSTATNDVSTQPCSFSCSWKNKNENRMPVAGCEGGTIILLLMH